MRSLGRPQSSSSRRTNANADRSPQWVSLWWHIQKTFSTQYFDRLSLRTALAGLERTIMIRFTPAWSNARLLVQRSRMDSLNGLASLWILYNIWSVVRELVSWLELDALIPLEKNAAPSLRLTNRAGAM